MTILTHKMTNDLYRLRCSATVKSPELGQFVRMTEKCVHRNGENYTRAQWTAYVAMLTKMVEQYPGD